MRMKNFRQAAGFVILVVSLSMLVWAAWPFSEAEQVVELTGDLIQKIGATTAPQIERLTLRTTWPVRLQVGRTAEIDVRLLAVQPNIAQETIMPLEGVIEARLELPGFQFAPDGIIRQAFTPATPVEFHWQVRPLVSGRYRGAVWLHRVEPPESGQESSLRHLISVRPVEIQALMLLGFNAYTAQLIGILGVILGAALCVDALFEWVSRKKKKRSK